MSLPESLGIAFAIHCDQNGLGVQAVRELADKVMESIDTAAEDCIELRNELHEGTTQ